MKHIWHRIGAFWQEVTDGLSMGELSSSFRREARGSLAVYTAETGRDVGEEWSEPKHRARVVFMVIRAMFNRLSPARRILFLLAIVLTMAPRSFQSADGRFTFDAPTDLAAVVILILLLVLELADRVGLKRDLEIARDIQGMLLPDKPPDLPGVDIAFRTKPANTVAGDYYDAFLRPAPAGSASESHLLVLVADVAGKGIPAGMLMANLQASIHVLASEPVPLTDLMPRLNRSFSERSGNGRHYVTAFLGELDPLSHDFTWVNAGHNQPLLVRVDGAVEHLAEGGLPLGMFAGTSYQCGQTRLRDGDALYIYTDGVTETVDDHGEEFGDSRLENLVTGMRGLSAGESLRRLFSSVARFAGEASQSDDITCLVLRVGAPEEATASRQPELLNLPASLGAGVPEAHSRDRA